MSPAPKLLILLRATAVGSLVALACVILTDAAIAQNFVPFPIQITTGAGLRNEGGTLILSNTTVADNTNNGRGGGGLANFQGGTVILTNSTIADNRGAGSGGLFNAGDPLGPVSLTNTILARNTGANPDCSGPVTSLGTNVVGDPTGCTITLLPTDLMGDPGLGDFTDDGTPGNGHIPLRRGSPAIDAGNDAFCPPTDQLGRRRVNIRRVGTSLCDIGAIEFRPRDDRQHDEEDD